MITTNFIFEKHSEPYLASMWVNHKLVWGNCARKSCEGIFETGQSWQRTRKLGSNDWLEKFPMIQLTQWPYDKNPCSLPWTIIFTIATCYSVQLNTNFIMPKKASSIWHQFSDKKPQENGKMGTFSMKCNHCEKRATATKSVNTNLWKHVKVTRKEL